jgi:DNA-binding response OmpR family regulator
VQTRAAYPGRLLVVDDEPSMRDLLTRVLSNAGHEVAVAESGEEALTRIGKERFDLLIVDRNLPGMSGIDVLNQVRIQDPGLFAVMITAYPNAESEAAARSLGVHSYITKPFGIVTIVAAVDAAILAGRAAAGKLDPT